MTNTKSSELLRFFLFAYVISIGFTDILELPVFGSKLQLPEIIFIPLFFIWLIHHLKYDSIRNLITGKLELSILLFILVAMLSTLVNGSNKSWFEVIGLIYLVLVFVVFKTSLRILPDSLKFIQYAFIVSGIVAAISGIIGWILTRSGIDTMLTWPANIYYPYLGYIGRATGFMVSPNMLFNLLGICLLIFFPHFLDLKRRKITSYLIIYVLAIGAILTFSKSIVLLVIALMYIIYKKKIRSPFYQFSMISIGSLLFLIWMAGTHILIHKSSETDWRNGREKSYTLSEPFKEIGGFQLFKTNYLINKESALRAGMRNPILGVGPGNFNEFVGRLKEEGLYPAHFINFDPHSTYLGSFAEMGFLGLLSLTFLCFQIIKSIRIVNAHTFYDRSFLISISACFLFMALEAISMDIINFRHLWILLGVLSYFLSESILDENGNPY